MAKFGNTPNVEGYIVFNADGIVVRYHGKVMTYQMAVHYAALLTDYWDHIKKIFGKTLNPIFNKTKENTNEHEVEYIRMRTKNETELILTSHSDFFLVCIQNCSLRKKVTENLVDQKIKNVEKKVEAV